MKQIGQILAFIAWILTSVLVAMQYNVIWGAVNLFIPPVSLVGSLFVFTWPLYLVALALVVFGQRREERRDDAYLNTMLAASVAATAGAAVRVAMNGIAFHEPTYAGPGTFYGFDDGRYLIETARTGARLSLDAKYIDSWGAGTIGVDGPASTDATLVVAPGVFGAPNICVEPPAAALMIAWLSAHAPAAAAAA